jgi:hypothetical protein
MRTGGPIVIERYGRPVATLLELEAYERGIHRAPASANRSDLARSAFGMWADRQDLDEGWLRKSREHWRSDWTAESGRQVRGRG